MNPKPPTHLLIPVSFAQEVVNYLETKAFREVAGMIQRFTTLPPAPVVEAVAPTSEAAP